MRFDSPEFKKLQKIWNKKLTDSGFQDAEQPDGMLKEWSTRFRTHHADPSLYEAKEEYFRRAGQFLHSHAFEDKDSKRVWSMHAQGVSNRDIAKKLKVKTKKRIDDLVKGLKLIMLEQLKVHSNE